MALAAPVLRAARPAPEEQPHHRPSLRVVVARPLVAGRLPFALLVGSVLGAGLVALLLLHTLAAQDAFRLQALQERSATLGDTEQQLAITEQQAQAPAALAARARALGMVPTGSIAFVRMGKHGRIIGVAHAAPPAPPAPAPTSTATKTARTGTGAHSGTGSPTTGSTNAGTTTRPRHHRRGTAPATG